MHSIQHKVFVKTATGNAVQSKDLRQETLTRKISTLEVESPDSIDNVKGKDPR